MAKSEFALIDWIRRQQGAGRRDIVTAIGDDMAVLSVGREKILVTTDMLLDGVHFDTRQASLRQIGYKAMACSLSDCAAMAAEPWCAVVSVALPRGMSITDAQELHAGVQTAGTRYGCELVGGDTTSWEQPLAINVCMLGRGQGVEPVGRNGAQPGEVILVTGSLGGSLRGRHLTFEPRVREARKLASLARITAMIDLSDGLASDLGHICRESGVSAVVQADKVPISSAGRETADPLQAALSDGEDFELLLTASAEDAEKVVRVWPELFEVPLTAIGEVLQSERPDKQVIYIEQNGVRSECAAHGWEHFQDE